MLLLTVMNDFLNARGTPLKPSDVQHALAALNPHDLHQPSSTLLDQIASARSADLITALVTGHGMNIDAATTVTGKSNRLEGGYTLLWFGCYYGFPEIITVCLDLGADPMRLLPSGHRVYLECFYGLHWGRADVVHAMMFHPRSPSLHECPDGSRVHTIYEAARHCSRTPVRFSIAGWTDIDKIDIRVESTSRGGLHDPR
jgi:hypothetical protein